MQYYLEEPGILYDSLLFLSFYHEYKEPAQSYKNTYFLEIKEKLLKNSIVISEHLSPLVSRQGKQGSFLSVTLFHKKEYSQCSFSMMERTIKNIPKMRSKFVEFYFTDAEPVSRQIIVQQKYPDVIGLLKQAPFETSLQTDLLYILFHFDEAMREVLGIINQVRGELEKQHRQFAEQNAEKLKQIQQAPLIDKLRAISGLPLSNTAITYSLSLLDEEKISFRPGEPDFFILGSRFDNVLDTKYKYCHVTPSSFIRALGNEAKRVIFEALLNMRPMSSADMETELHLSRNAVARNIKELRESGVVTVEHTEGLSYYYTLNKEYIGIVVEQLEQLKYQMNNSGTATGS